ncbi:hypothetical protein B566_EDAN007488 [Ephemera danica]|nr:hypothetical protein B566_EDAN007488 [Ephemera danica]
MGNSWFPSLRLSSREISSTKSVTGIEVLPGNKVVQKIIPTTTTIVADSACSHADRSEQERAKKIAVPNGPRTNKPEESHSNVGSKYVYQCADCSGKYASKSDFAKHKCGGNFACDVCSAKCMTGGALKVHQKQHDREALESKMNSACTETSECKTCGAKVGNNMAEAHQLSHVSGLKIFQCKLCPASYLSVRKLNDHISKSHGKSKAYSCDICSKTFKTISYLKSHMELHKADKKYKCTYCEKLYHRKQDKLKHEYVHTGEKPAECNTCGKCFRTPFSLSVHLTSHTNERPYACSFCPKRFKSRAVCAHHVKLHGDSRPYTCQHCPQAFKTQVALAGHVNRHTKPYSCDVCHKQFATKFSVKAHMPLHNKPEKRDRFRCSVCGEVYARQTELLEHLKDSHTNVAEIVREEQTQVDVEYIVVEGQEEIIVGD